MQYKYMLGKYNAGGCADAAAEYAADSDVLYGVSEAGKARLFSAHGYEAYVTSYMTAPTAENGRKHGSKRYPMPR
jgi:hypothetical protein